ncbi:MAG: hypothetical protein J2P21_12360, partial [Chloracidobacterium sp.]|nr:hypothetical protein [Chloracidobacterium sp.]
KHWAPLAQEALQELIAQGWAREKKGRDGRIHYRINRRKARQIHAMLERIEAQQAQPDHTTKIEEDS